MIELVLFLLFTFTVGCGILFTITGTFFGIPSSFAKSEEKSLEEKLEKDFGEQDLSEIQIGFNPENKQQPLHTQIENEEYPGEGKLTQKEKSYIGLNTYPTILGTLVEINIREDGVYGSFLLDHPLPDHNFETYQLNVEDYREAVEFFMRNGKNG